MFVYLVYRFFNLQQVTYPFRTPARKLTSTPTPMGGLSGFHMQSDDKTVDPGLAQPPGNLPFLKPDDAQYFGKLLVRVSCHCCLVTLQGHG